MRGRAKGCRARREPEWRAVRARPPRRDRARRGERGDAGRRARDCGATMSPADSTLRPALRPDAAYFADSGRAVCLRCAGMSALYTGRDISGQRVERATVEDCRVWEREIGRALSCESRCTTLAPIAGPDGWPLANGGAR